MNRSISKYLFTVIAILLAFAGAGCSQITSQNTHEKPVIKLGYEQEQLKKNMEVKAFKSNLTNETNLKWKTARVVTRLGKQVQQYFFINKEKGWAFGENFYKTEDGGNKWDIVNIDKPKNTLIRHVRFLNENTGWAISQKRDENYSRLDDNHAWLFETSDGGKSWLKRTDLGGVVLNDFDFANEKIGWIVGRKYAGVNPIRFEIFILVTNDGGKSWREVSKSLNKTVSEYQKTINQSIGAVAYSEGQITLVSAGRQIFQTADFGENWIYVADLPDNLFESAGVKRIGYLETGLLWFTFGQYHYGGAMGILISQVNNHWEQNELENVYFSAGAYLSSEEVVVCGFKTQKNKKPVGIILHSSDRGRIWTTLFKSNQTDGIWNLQVLDNSTVIAWDGAGNIYILDRSHF